MTDEKIRPPAEETSAVSHIGSGTAPLSDVETLQTETAARGGRTVSRGRLVLRRFVRRRLAVVGLVLLVLEALFAWIGPHVGMWDYTQVDFLNFGSGPSADHWWGTDPAGHDIYAQTLAATQKSMVVGLIAALVTTALAALVGSVAGYFGKWVDNTLMWLVNLLMVIPSFLILAIISPRLGQSSFLVFAVLLAVFSWMLTARVVRGLTLSLREREFVSAARFMGVPAWRIIVRHILPNMASLLIVDVTINVSATILLETSLSYFGFGIQPPAVSLGTLIGDGTGGPDPTYQSWRWAFPGGMLLLLVLAVNFIGDGLRDALDATSGSSEDK